LGKVTLPKRSRRFGIGKEIGGAVYVHRNYESVLGAVVTSARDQVLSDFCYTVVKYSYRTGTVTFIASPDFDTSPEPIAGEHWVVPFVGPARFRPRLADPYIYHHKWLMVSESYQGFDVGASKERSLQWLTLPNVDKARIGRLSYWHKHVQPRLVLLSVGSAAQDVPNPLA
jgi:hypothetical protein